MSVVMAGEYWEGRDGSFESVTNNTLSRSWKVKTDNKNDNQLVIVDHFAAAFGIEFLSPHPDNLFYTARKLDVKQDSASPYVWRVTVTYSTEPLWEDEDKEENPLDRPPKISGDSEMSQTFTTKDKDGLPVLNSAGDPLEPWEVDDPRGTIVIERNFPEIPSFLSAYINKVNDADFEIPGFEDLFPARTVKFQRFRFGAQERENDVSFVAITVELSVKPDTWDVYRLDEGFHEKLGSFRQKILLNDGSEPSEPVPLNGAGAHLSEPDPNNAVYLVKKYYQEADFSVLFS